MNKSRWVNTGIVISGLVFILAQIVISRSFSDFTGTDDQSVDTINEIAPDYEPWVETIFDFTTEQNEVILFALQAAIGIGVIVFYVLKKRQRRT
ncbi:MAG: energy-coupling factor ABC transporter substrate-binding protein [Bacteroidota bacterium]